MGMTEQKRDRRIGKLLAFDTSTGVLTAALSEERRIVAERFSEAERNHSILLLPEIAGMLQEAGWSPAEVDAVAVGTGPGSYTGVRIAVTVAKTFAWSLGIPVIGVSGLAAMALGDARADERREPPPRAAGWYIPLLDARRKQAYCAVYAADKAGWRTVVDDGIRLLDQWLEELDRLLAFSRERGEEPGRLVFGGETAGFRETIADWSASVSGFGGLEIRTSAISAASVAELAWRRIENGEADDTHRLVPNYTQLAEAEAKLLLKQKQGGEPRGAD